jgi:Na+-driven multidrug efflux pump
MGATAAVAGQNLGAGRPDRSAGAARVAASIGLGVAAAISFLFVVIPGPLLGAFSLNEGIPFQIGRQLLQYLAVSAFFVTVALVYTGGLQGTGDTRGPLFISIISQVVVPIGLCTLFASTTGLQAAHIWSAIVLGHATRATLSVIRFRQGKWRAIAVKVGPAQA